MLASSYVKKVYALSAKKVNVKQGLFIVIFALILYFFIVLFIKNIVVLVSLFDDSPEVLAIFEQLKSASVRVPWLVVIGYGICAGLLLKVKRIWVILPEIFLFLIGLVLGIYLSRVNGIPFYGFLHILILWIKNGVFDLYV